MTYTGEERRSGDHGERIVALEIHCEQQRDFMQVQQAQNEIINNKLDRLDHTMTKYHGFLGGVMFIATGIWVFFTQLKDWFK